MASSWIPGQAPEARARGGRAATRASSLIMESADRLARLMAPGAKEEDTMRRGVLTPEARLKDLERKLEDLQLKLDGFQSDERLTPMKLEQMKVLEDDFGRLWKQYVGILGDMNQEAQEEGEA